MSNNSELNIFVSTFLEEARDNLELWEKTCLDLEKNPSQELFATLFRLAHNLKGSARSVGLETFGSFIHKVEDIISLLRDGQREFNIEFISLFFKCHTILDNWCEELHKDLNYTPKDLCEFEGYIRQFNPSTGENKTEDQSFGVFAEEERPDKVENKKIAEPITKINSSNKIDTIRVPINKIETIMNHISELCSNHAIIFHCKSNNKYSSSSFNNAVNICKKIIKELQSNVFSLRMVPLTSIFQRLERTAVSLAIQQNKKIEIIMDGSHIEIDKIIIEKIMDPLVHVIRNAVDHAIEHEEERIKKSKPLISTIKISAMQNTSHVIITITDDGRGINAKNVFQKAVQKNMVAENAKLSEQEIYQFLFSPGFSTAEKITEVSGRGVGLDVVKQVLHEIGGHVNIQSQVDIGSKFEFHLPSNLSIIETLIIKTDNLNYVIPISEIEEVLDLSKFKIDTVTNSERMLFLRETPVIIKNLNSYLLNHNKEESDTKISHNSAILIEFNKQLYAFEIDHIIGIESIVFKKKSEKLNEIKFFTGSAVLPNGEPAFILSLKELISQLVLPNISIIHNEILENKI